MARVKSPHFVPVICNALRKSWGWLRTRWRPLQLWAYNGEPIFLLLLGTGKAEQLFSIDIPSRMKSLFFLDFRIFLGGRSSWTVWLCIKSVFNWRGSPLGYWVEKYILCITMSILGGHGWVPVPHLFAKQLFFHLIPALCLEKGRKEGRNRICDQSSEWLA